MKQLWMSYGLLIGCWALPLAGAPGQERAPQKEELPPPPVQPSPTPLPAPVPAAPGCPSCAPCVDRTISVPRMTLMEQQEATTIPKLNVREVVVGKACGLDVDYREEKQVVMEWALKPREVVQQVPCMTLTPVTVTDPCTGQCRTEYKSCPIVREVKITVYDAVPVPRTVVVSVPCLKPGQPLLVQKLVVDTTIEPAIRSRFHLLAMPNEVHVPACPACPVPHP